VTRTDQIRRQPRSLAAILPLTCLLTVPMLGWMTSAFWWRQWGFNSVLYGLTAFGGLSLLVYPIIYLCGLYFYGKRLRSVLAQVPEAQRQIAPNVVWLVLAVPLNFVGTFYVISGIAQSLRVDARLTPADIRRWSTIGMSWAALQVLAFFPNMVVSFIGMLLAYVVWAIHWFDSVRLDELLQRDVRE
jgi:hypothetical protein